MYIWHKDAKSKKFHAKAEPGEPHYIGVGADRGLLFPTSEYAPCPPPSEWKDLTSGCRLDKDRTAIALINSGKTIAVSVPGFRFAESLMIPIDVLPMSMRPFAVLTLEKVYRIEEDAPIST